MCVYPKKSDFGNPKSEKNMTKKVKKNEKKEKKVNQTMITSGKMIEKNKFFMIFVFF